MNNDLANLDFLRAFAVLLVALGHFLMYAGKGSWTGWMGLTGVCLFFVHTCLVLMWSLERDRHVGRFYIRRIFRLFPLWLVVLAFVVSVRLPVSPIYAPTWRFFTASAGELAANATLTFNLWYGARIVGASWSLPVEAQMYLFLPALFFLARRRWALWALLAMDALFIYLSARGPVPIQATLLSCVPYFIPGVLAYVLVRKVKPVLPAWSFVLFLLGMAAIHHRYGTLRRSSYFCLGIGLALPFFRQMTWRPAVRTSHLIARYSYGIYLCHIPAICLGLHYLHGYNVVLRLAAILVTLAAASVGLYHVVELPMIRLGVRLAKRIEPGPGPRLDKRALSLETVP